MTTIQLVCPKDKNHLTETAIVEKRVGCKNCFYHQKIFPNLGSEPSLTCKDAKGNTGCIILRCRECKTILEQIRFEEESETEKGGGGGGKEGRRMRKRQRKKNENRFVGCVSTGFYSDDIDCPHPETEITCDHCIYGVGRKNPDPQQPSLRGYRHNWGYRK